MFFSTPTKLLRPTHSLLKAPFDFLATASITERLRDHLCHRTDFRELAALGCLYDEARQGVQRTLVALRPRLENELSSVIPIGANLRHLCNTEFKGKTPRLFEIDGAQYLSHVSVQCQIERLYDLMGLRKNGTKDALDVVEVGDAIHLLMLSEALALCLAGIARVEHADGQFQLSAINPTARDTLRCTWFARMADQGSHTATLVFAKELALSNAITIQDIEPLIERILDQSLSIPWRMVAQQGRALKSVQRIYEAAALVAILTIMGVRQESVRMAAPCLARHGLNFSAVSDLIRHQTEALITDQFIIRNGNTLEIRIEGASKGLRQYFRSLESEFGEQTALRDHIGGFFFEKTHIRQRIEDGHDYKPRYRVLEGFDRYKVIGNFQNESDVEFIIHDAEQHHYYFVQVKHALLGEKAYFNSVVEAVQQDLGKGIHQLREAKRLLEQNCLNETLRHRGIQDATAKNSSFVLLHNIAQFDFQSTDDGIALYDWATFRNLLKDAECNFGSSSGQRELLRLPSPLVIDHPMHVIRRLLDDHPAYQAAFTDPWATERATTSYTVLGKTILVNGLGI